MPKYIVNPKLQWGAEEVDEKCTIRVDSKFFRIGSRETRALRAWGTSSPDEQLLREFIRLHFVIPEGEEISPNFQGGPARVQVGSFGSGYIRIRLLNPQGILRFISKSLNPEFVVGIVLVFISLLMIFIFTHSVAWTDFLYRNISWGPLLGMWSFFTLSSIVHELGHGLAAAYCGVPVEEAGFMLFYIQPAAYINVSYSYLVSSKKRIYIQAAGSFAQLGFTAIALDFLFILPLHLQHSLWWLFVANALNALYAFMNFIPFVKMDGYWILCTVLDSPNLRLHVLTKLTTDLQTLCSLGSLKTKVADGSLALFRVLYACISLVFTISLYVLGVYGIELLLARLGVVSPYSWYISLSFLALVFTIQIRGQHRLNRGELRREKGY